MSRNATEATINARIGKKGEFLRHDSKHRNLGVEDEAGRYHLHVALACPWAAGALSVLFLKGLEDAIGHSVVHPTWARTKPDDDADTHCGWVFKSPGDAALSNSMGHGSFECDDALRPDTATGCQSIREIYELCGDLDGPFTTPLLFDKKERRIVSNESMDILRILNSAFNGVARHPDVDLYPSTLQSDLAKLNDAVVYPNVNNGVYRCGFARSQEAYNDAVREVFAALGQLEGMLGKTRFLGGDTFTWLDLRLYHTLVRFDPVYVTYFKTNARRIEDYPNLSGFMRDVFSKDAVQRSTSLKHIKMHYFSSHPHLNPFGIIPICDGQDLSAVHSRAAL